MCQTPLLDATELAWNTQNAHNCKLPQRESVQIATTTSKQWAVCQTTTPSASFSIQAAGCHHLILGFAPRGSTKYSDVQGLHLDFRTGRALWSPEIKTIVDGESVVATGDQPVVWTAAIQDGTVHFWRNGALLGVRVEIPASLSATDSKSWFPTIATKGHTGGSETSVTLINRRSKVADVVA
ncbi:hypothetical protein LEN26_004714 [Aphanomyces euteiches]|nr:hypothetical protein AeMF1_006241 [Aphanomyces euteiches]KAH9147456.1 hypothetical protein LEN26_004714 [Aphanomyces euteiches]KAH9181060.1 hypothetical protein AeNC1_016965 [Aphanomyces euteiches]